MGKSKCPYCKETVDLFWDDEVPDAYYWCNLCGEMSLYTDNPVFVPSGQKIALIAPTEKERELIHGEWDKKYPHRLNSVAWLPSIDKKRLHFNIMILHNGETNFHEIAEKYDFREAQNYAKLVYHKMGFMPSIGDVVRGRFFEPHERGPIVKDNVKGMYSDQDFVIVQRDMGLNDYDEMILIVVFHEAWLAKQGY